MGRGGLCYLNQRAADSQPANADGICQLLRGTRTGVGKGRKQEKEEKQDNHTKKGKEMEDNYSRRRVVVQANTQQSFTPVLI